MRADQPCLRSRPYHLVRSSSRGTDDQDPVFPVLLEKCGDVGLECRVAMADHSAVVQNGTSSWSTGTTSSRSRCLDLYAASSSTSLKTNPRSSGESVNGLKQ